MPNTPQTILITGSAGFIGSNLVLRLLDSEEPLSIVGLDNLNDYYDPSLKEYRLGEIQKKAAKAKRHTYQFIKGDIADKAHIDRLFAENHFDIVVNLAAQAGVRYSIENPDAYIQSNMIGFYNILEASRHSYDGIPGSTGNPGYRGVQHLVYASSSSVYGGNKKVPFSTDDRVDNPVSLYAATKKSNELFAHCYSKLYHIPSTGLRFFTVYGPAGRPDMAYFGFTNKLLKGQTIQIYNYGNCRRDFTYVDDIVEGIVRVMRKAPEKRTGEDGLPIPRMPSTTSAAASPRTCWTSSTSSRRNSSAPASSPPTTTSRPTRSSCRCSRATSPPSMPMRQLLNGILGLRRRLRCGKGSGSLPSGTKNTISIQYQLDLIVK